MSIGRRAASAVGLLALGAGVAGGSGCKTKTTGELLLVIQSDLSLPKDIDTISIDVDSSIANVFHRDYPQLGTKDGLIKLPGTLGVVLGDSTDGDIATITVSARTGGPTGAVVIVDEIVTTVPAAQVSVLPVPIHFLCEGFGKVDQSGKAVTTCPSGQSCVAGSCTGNKVDSSKLPPYSTPDQVYGNGSCFDGTACWDSATPATLTMMPCSIPPTGQGSNVNVALQTEGQGICGPTGCFVTLDEGAADGWTLASDGTINLPQAVCTQISAGKIVNVVTTPVTGACQQKKQSLPTCGPWSNAKNNPPAYTGPVALAGGQPRPVSLIVSSNAQAVFWTTAGLMGSSGGTIKGVSLTGGAPLALAAMPNQAPRDLLEATAAGAQANVYWTSAPGAMGAGSIVDAPVLSTSASMATTFVSGLNSPEGIASNANSLFWTDFQGGGIFQTPLASGSTMTQVAMGNYPYRIAADNNFLYWTNEGTAGSMPPDGSVMSYDLLGMKSVMIATQLDTPRALAYDTDAGGDITAIYWATLAQSGAIMSATISDGVASAPVTLASGLNYPNGIAVDVNNVYWTNRGDGTVMMLSKSAPAGTGPTTLAKGQLAPGEIVVDSTNMYWVNEGASDHPSGAVLKLALPQ